MTNVDVYLYQGEAQPNDVRLRELSLQNSSIRVADGLAVIVADDLPLITVTAYTTEALLAGLFDDWREVLGTEVEGTGIAFTHWKVYDELPIHLTPASTPTSASVNTTDSCAAQVSDTTPAVFATVSVADSCAVAGGDSQPLLTVSNQTLTDTCVVVASDPQPLITVSNQTLTDTCAVVANPEAPGIVVTLSVLDDVQVQVSESTPSIVAVLTASDSCAVQISDDVPAIISAVGATDSTTGQVGELASIFSTVSLADSLGIGATESVLVLVTLSASDSTLAQLSDLVAILVTQSVTDSCSVILDTELANVIQNTLLGTAESDVLGLTETTPIIGQAVQVTDSLAVQSTDLVQSPHTVATDEALVVQGSEVQTSFLATVASDVLPLIAIDSQPLIPLTVSVVDSLAILGSESATQQVVGSATPISASDSCSLILDEQIPPFLALSVSDSGPLGTDERIAALGLPAEVVALLLIESIRLEVTQIETFWGGGARQEQAGPFLYAGSYRMGVRNADETRAGNW